MEKNIPNKINSEDTQFKKRLEEETKNNRIRKTIVGAALTISTMANAMDDGSSSKEYTVPDLETATIEMTSEVDVEPDLKDTDYVFGSAFGEKTKPKTAETNPEVGEKNIEKFEHVFDTGFSMGKADLSLEQINELRTEFVSFLDALPQEIKDRIDKGESKIVVHGGASHHIVDPNLGVDSGTKGRVFDNTTLAQYRAEAGVKVLQENVFADVSGINNATMTIEKHIYSETDAGKELEDGRRLRISIEDIVELSPTASSIQERVIKNLPNGDIEFILNDASESNKGYAGELFSAAQKSGFIPEGGKVPFYVGTDYRDVLNKGYVSHSSGADNLTSQAQDESIRLGGEKKFTNKENMTRASLSVLEKLPNIPFAERIEGSTGSGIIVTDESISISLDQIEKLQAKERSKDVKLVYMLADRKSREVASVTLDQMKDILINNLGAEKNTAKLFSIDINDSEIEGGQADYLIKK